MFFTLVCVFYPGIMMIKAASSIRWAVGYRVQVQLTQWIQHAYAQLHSQTMTFDCHSHLLSTRLLVRAHLAHLLNNENVCTHELLVIFIIIFIIQILGDTRGA